MACSSLCGYSPFALLLAVGSLLFVLVGSVIVSLVADLSCLVAHVAFDIIVSSREYLHDCMNIIGLTAGL